MSHLNENQQRFVIASLRHLDSLLETTRSMASPELSPFAHERPDLSPDEARLVASFVTFARNRMLVALNRFGIPRPEPTISARWSARTALSFADVTATEIGPETLAGYGPVSSDAGTEIEALRADLRDILRQGLSILDVARHRDYLLNLETIPGAMGDAVRALDRVIEAHELFAMRPLLEAIVDRLTSGSFDIGLFGRVSTGKSSLINALVGSSILPVGVTPVTSVPVRIGHGDDAMTVQFRSGETQSLGLEQITDFITEEHNPQNRLGVRSVTLSTLRAPAGVRWLDTPGVGTATPGGAAQTMAWLARCDFGLVLIGASSAMGPDELALITGLANARVPLQVLLSKADLLSPSEAEQSLAYIRQELDRVLGPHHGIEAVAVSSREAARGTVEQLRNELLHRRAEEHRRHGAERIRQRMLRLAAQVNGALKTARGTLNVDRHFQRVAEARQEINTTTRRLAQAGSQTVEDAAAAVVEAWNRGENPTNAARSVVLRAAGDTVRAVRTAIERAAPQMLDRSGLIAPVFNPPPPDLSDGLTFTDRLSGRLAAARRRLHRWGEEVEAGLADYAVELRAWGLGLLDAAPSDDSEPSDLTPGRVNEELIPVYEVLGVDTVSPSENREPDHGGESRSGEKR